MSGTGERPTLVVSASANGADAPTADFSLELAEAKPTAGAVVYDAASALGLDVDVAFTQTGAQAVYSYSKGDDATAKPEVSSSCSVTVSELSSHWATGQVACRNLLAAQTSADATLPDGSRGRASATIAFDCPIRAFSAPMPGSGGSESSAGSSSGGSSSFGGTDAGGTAGTAAVGGTLGVGGTAEKPKSCHGVVQSCALTSVGLCSSVLGCSTSGKCGGVSFGCYGYSQYSCGGQQGCVWYSSSKYCSGSAWSCNLFHGSASCVYQEGCHWDDTCEGIATDCSLLSEGSCASQPGCSWD